MPGIVWRRVKWYVGSPLQVDPSRLTTGSTKLHTSQGHPDEQILQHTQEILSELAAAGVEPNVDGDAVDEAEEHDDDAWVDDDGDVEMD